MQKKQKQAAVEPIKSFTEMIFWELANSGGEVFGMGIDCDEEFSTALCRGIRQRARVLRNSPCR